MPDAVRRVRAEELGEAEHQNTKARLLGGPHVRQSRGGMNWRSDPPRHAALKSSGKWPFPLTAELCPHASRPSGGSSDPEGRAMPIVQHLETIARAPATALDALARAVWQDFGAGKLAEAEATTVVEAIEARRRALRRPIQAHSPLRMCREGRGRTGASNKRREPGSISARDGSLPRSRPTPVRAPHPAPSQL